MAITTAMAVPLHSVQTADWLVYADWAMENPGQAVYSEDATVSTLDRKRQRAVDLGILNR